MSYFQKIIVLMFLQFSSFAQAGFYIEPFVGYQAGNTDYKIKDTVPTIGGSEDKGTVTGGAAGIGLGWKPSPVVRLGLEHIVSSMTTKYEGTTAESTFTQNTSYLMVGYHVKPETHIYLGLGTMSSITDKSPTTKTTGTAAKLGAHHVFGKHLAVSGEVTTYTISEAETEGSSAVKTADFYDKLNNTATNWYLRFPFEFGGR